MRAILSRAILFTSGTAFALGGLVAGAVMIGSQQLPKPGAPALQAAWTEIGWPFPPDPWGKGKAFRCPSAQCGLEMTVFVRAKLGFCNCATGVADDEELARIGDLDLLAHRASALGPGRPITVGWMKGRSRSFSLPDAREPAPSRSALSIGFNDRCDALVATALVDGAEPVKAEARVLELLNGPTVAGWIEVALGL